MKLRCIFAMCEEERRERGKKSNGKSRQRRRWMDGLMVDPGRKKLPDDLNERGRN